MERNKADFEKMKMSELLDIYPMYCPKNPCLSCGSEFVLLNIGYCADCYFVGKPKKVEQ